MKINLNDRILDVINEEFDGNISKFSKLISVPLSTLRNVVGGRRSSPSGDILVKMACSIEHLNCDWLLKGKGNMLLSDSSRPDIIITSGANNHNINTKISNRSSGNIETYRVENNSQEKTLKVENEFLKKLLDEKERYIVLLERQINKQ